jgi:hypothetical protein
LKQKLAKYEVLVDADAFKTPLNGGLIAGECSPDSLVLVSH